MKRPIKISTQVIEKKGKPEYVVIPYDEFQELAKVTEGNALIEFELLNLTLKESETQEITIPHEVVKLQVLHEISLMRAWREYLGMTQKEVAEKAGISQPAYLKIENEISKPRPSTLSKIAAVMGIAAEQLTSN